MHHPEHDRLTRDVPGWYRTSSPDMGYLTEWRQFGYYCRNLKARGSAANSVSVEDVSASQVKEFLPDIREYYGQGTVRIHVDDRDMDARIRDALISHGCIKGKPQVYLAHVGPVPKAVPLPDLRVQPVSSEILPRYARVKLMGFADSESEPGPDDLEEEVSLREAEMAGPGRFYLAGMRGEDAGIIGLYHKADYLIFQLATRVPFRRQGIATHLVSSVLTDADQEANYAVIINADPSDTPVGIYKRLGFADEVFWRQEYTYAPGNQ